MENLRLKKVVETDGEIRISGLPFKKGQTVEMILKTVDQDHSTRPLLTARQLLHSKLPGIWADRNDIGGSSDYARRLREQAQKRERP